MYKIAFGKISALFNAISSVEKLYVPTDKDDIAVFAEYRDGVELTQKLNTNRSAKDFFFPQTENLYDVKMKDKKIEITDTREECEDFVIFGVRACDVRSFSILDKVYLADPIDSYYKNRRDHGTIISLACGRPEETCFCQSFGINAADPEGDVKAWKIGDELYLQGATDKGNALLEKVSSVLESADEKAVDDAKSAINAVMKKLPLAKVSFEHMKDNDLLDYFNSDKWSGLSEACLGCGTLSFARLVSATIFASLIPETVLKSSDAGTAVCIPTSRRWLTAIRVQLNFSASDKDLCTSLCISPITITANSVASAAADALQNARFQ